MLRILFAHPLVEAVTGWDFADGAWLGAPSGLVRRDNTLKPAYQALDRLIHEEWTTSIHAATDAEGRLEFEGVSESGEEMSASAEGMPASGEEMLATGEGMPASGEEMPASAEEMPTPGEGMPTSGEGMPAPGEGMPAPGEGMPASGEGMSTPGEGMPAPGEGAQMPEGGPAGAGPAGRFGKGTAEEFTGDFPGGSMNPMERDNRQEQGEDDEVIDTRLTIDEIDTDTWIRLSFSIVVLFAGIFLACSYKRRRE